MAQRCSPKSGTETRPLEVPTEDENGYKEKDVFFFFCFTNKILRLKGPVEVDRTVIE